MSELRKFGPKTSTHPSIGTQCPTCHQPFKEGDFTTLISLGPGDNEEARKRISQGRPYNAIALEVHWACATGEED